MARVFLELLGDQTSAHAAVTETTVDLARLAETSSATADKLAINATKSASTQVASSEKIVASLRAQMAAYKELYATASASQRGILEQAYLSRSKRVGRLTGAEALGITGLPIVAGGAGAAETDAAALEQRRISERNASQFLRGGTKGLGGLGGLGFAALAGGTFIGAYAGAASLRAVVSAAQEAQASEKLLANATKNVGASFTAWKPTIDKSVQSLSDMSGFTNQQITQGLVQLVRSTGNVSEALKLSGLAADIARGRNIDYNTSALLISKVVNGNVGLLKRYGVAVQSGATVTEALDAAFKKFGGTAEAYGKTSAGAFDRLHSSIRHVEETIGKALLPDLTRAASATANWLNKMEKSGKIQADLHGIHDRLMPIVVGFKALTVAIEGATHAWNRFHSLAITPIPGLDIFASLAKVYANMTASGQKFAATLRGFLYGAPGRGTSDAAVRAEQAQIARDARRVGGDLYPGRGSTGGTLDKFAISNLPQALQNQIARAVTPAQKKAADQAEIDAITKLLDTKGALSPAARTQAFKDRARAEAQIAQIDKAAAAHATATANKAAAAVSKDPLLAKAKLDLAQGDTAAADRLLRTDKARLEEELKQAKTAEMRLAITKQLTAVEKALQAKDAGFVESKKLQMEQARADALAALSGGTTALQIKLAEQLKAAAMKAINSHRLTMQGLIDAWNAVGQANSVLAQAQGMVNTYHVVSTKALVQGLGLTQAQQAAVRERAAQAQAHRGYAPNGPAVEGQVIHVTIHSDIDQTITKIDKHHRRRHQRAGGRR